MELKSDIVIKGSTWYKVNQGLVKRVFDTQWGLFKICLSIGILYDKQLEEDRSNDAVDGINIPRTMFNRYAGEMQFFFQKERKSSKNHFEKSLLLIHISASHIALLQIEN